MGGCRRTPRIALALGTLLVIAAAPSRAAETQHLTLLHTSDLHGSVLPFDDTRNRPEDGSLAQIATLVGRIRAETGHPVLLLDSGDTIQGTPLEEFAHVRWSEPSPTIEAMNLMGYDAMAVGNHEFNFGLEVLRRAQRQADFPFLSANTVDAGGRAAFPERMVVEVGEVRVGIVGLVTPNIPGWERPEHYRGLAFRAMDETAREQVSRLRGSEGCDLVVVLAHTGFEDDLDSGEPTDTGSENFGVRLTRVAGIDVLLTGHTHDDIPPRQVNGVIVSQPSGRGRTLTRIDLELERDGDAGWRLASWRGDNLEVAGVAPDPAVSAASADLHRRVVEALDGPVGEITEPLSIADCRLEDCAALDLIHEVQLEASGAELSLASLLSRRTPDLPAGPVTWRWVYALYVYPNTLVELEVTGREVLDILEHAARYFDGLECSADGLCTVLTDPAIPPYNVDTMAGVSYRIDPTRPEGQRVRDARVDGRPLDLRRRFTLVCNNYRAVGGGGYPHLADATRIWQSSAEMTALIGDFIARSGSWEPLVDSNWWLAPPLIADRPASAATDAVTDE